MSDDSQDESQKTEDATQHRLDEARKKGQIVFSKELMNFALFASFTIVLSSILPKVMTAIFQGSMPMLASPDAYNIENFSIFFPGLGNPYYMQAFLLPCLIFFAVLVGCALAQTKLNVSSEPLKPNLERISIIKGVGRLFSRRSVIEFLKGILKVIICSVTCYLSIKAYLPNLLEMPSTDMGETMITLSMLIKRMLIGVCIVMFFIGVGDYLYQRYEHMRSMRMSIQEIKEEYKQQEGDPHIKAKIRGIRIARARKRMMAAVPKADVIITNPTHYAIALMYDSTKMRAPVMVAKGVDMLALKMKEIATAHKIPIVANPPLARSLYDKGDIDKEIPFDSYKAVAEVISFVYKLKGKTR